MDWSFYWTILAQLAIFLVLFPFPFAIFYWLITATVQVAKPTPPSGEWVIQGANQDDN